MLHLRSLVTTALAVSLAALAVNAHAADPIRKGTLALGAERLTALSHTNQSIGNADVKDTQITLLAQGAHGPWDLPRIGFDGFISDGLSIGGTLGIMHDSGTAAGFNGTETDFLLAPRVGYAIMFSDTIGMWPRGGLSYYHQSVDPDGPGETSGHYIGLNLECPFLFFLAPGFAISATPLVDLSLDGSRTTTVGNVSNTVDASYTSFGIVGGLVGFF